MYWRTKIREALARKTAHATLAGEVEVDGAYFGGRVGPENRKEDRKDRRLAVNQSPDLALWSPYALVKAGR